MATVEEELKEMQAAQEKTDAEIAEGKKALEQVQSQLACANGQRASRAVKITALEKMNRDLDAAKTALKVQREKAKTETAAAAEPIAKLQDRLASEVPQERAEAIAAVVAEIDDAIEKAKQKFQDARTKTAEAETAAASAKEKSTTLENKCQAAVARLQGLPKEIKAASERVTKLAADTKAALDAGRINDATLRFLELKETLEEVPNLESEQKENEMVNEVTETRQASMAAQDASSKASDDLSKLKEAQAAAEADFKKKTEKRDDDVKTALATQLSLPDDRNDVNDVLGGAAQDARRH